jgi:hypothetical protein
MNPESLALIHHTFEASDQGQLHFGQVIANCLQAGVESYHVDYRSGRSTYYLRDGKPMDLHFELPSVEIQEDLDAEALRAAIFLAQQGQIMYP